MKAVRIHQHGDRSVLKVESAPLPVPSTGDVLVRVHAAAANLVDALDARGFTSSPTARSQILGWDFAGTVVGLVRQRPNSPSVMWCTDVGARPGRHLRRVPRRRRQARSAVLSSRAPADRR